MNIGGRFHIVSESLIDFFKSHPFWASLIIILMVLPIIGAVIHIILKAFGRRGLDNAPIDSEPLTENEGAGASAEQNHPDGRHNESKT